MSAIELIFKLVIHFMSAVSVIWLSFGFYLFIYYFLTIIFESWLMLKELLASDE